MRANHHNPDEEEEYYREQLAYLDTMQTGPSKPQPQGQAAYSYPGYCTHARERIKMTLTWIQKHPIFWNHLHSLVLVVFIIFFMSMF